MAYNFKKIGKRIEENRRKLGMKSADSFSEKIEEHGGGRFTRQQIRDWEKGIKMPPEKAQLIMCNIFECDLGYLLCEYDYKTRPDTDIGEATGLSEAAIEKLKYLHSAPGSSGIMEALNTILTSVNFENALDHVGEYLEKSRLCHSLKENQIQNQYYSDEAQKMECQKYEAATHFSYTLDEIGSTPERRQRIFKAGMSGLFD